jgi:8-oxo-dGTP diphosphatase
VRKRRTARVMLFDESGAVLLIRFVAMRPDGEFVFWALPGGEIENGETEAEAAARELNEELGIRVAVEGPVYRDANQFWHQGEMQDNQDFLFRGRCGRDEPRLAGVTAEEIGMMREMRWWTAEQIEGSRERIFPAELADRVREQWGWRKEGLCDWL